MDRSFAGRIGIGRPLAPRRSGRGGWLDRLRAPRADADHGLLSRPVSIIAGLARMSRDFLARHRRLRIALLSMLVALPLLAGGWLLLRDSPLVSVEHVRVSGVHGPEAAAIDSALAGAARQMSTLDMHSGALRAAVAPYRVVREVHAYPSFPHGVRIRVVEQLPVAALTIAGVRTAVAADGVILGPGLLSSSLPTLSAGSGPSAASGVIGKPVHGALLQASLAVLGAAPSRMASDVSRVFNGVEGVTVVMRNGLTVYFGDATRPHAKWISLARVLADPSSAGASYVDVRLPERPAAGFAGSSAAPSAASASEAEPSSVSDPNTAAELAAGLTAALDGGSSPASPTSQATTATTPTETAAGATPETTSTAPPEGAPAATTEEPSTTPAPGG
jgi:cell division protein FtsQ